VQEHSGVTTKPEYAVTGNRKNEKLAVPAGHKENRPEMKQEKQDAVQPVPADPYVPEELQMQPEPVQLASAASVRQKKQRYVELDFNDQPIGAHAPSEPVMAAQQFRFRLGSQSVSFVDAPGNQVSFRKSF
jgi:hypothetical protein